MSMLCLDCKDKLIRNNSEGKDSGQKPEDKKMVSQQELLLAQMIQIDAVSQLLIEKGIITEEEFYAKLKQVQQEYQIKRGERG
jgi:hypothetical protein